MHVFIQNVDSAHSNTLISSHRLSAMTRQSKLYIKIGRVVTVSEQGCGAQLEAEVKPQQRIKDMK